MRPASDVFVETSTATGNHQLDINQELTMKVLSLVLSYCGYCVAFSPPFSPSSRVASALYAEENVQFELLQKHHLGEWKGTWTSYNQMGDVEDETIASVELTKIDDEIQQIHNIIVDSKQSDCTTCFDSAETKSFPVARYSPEQMGRVRCAASGIVIGPSLLRSGVMATELILKHGTARVRVILSHAPVWEGEEQVGPPQGLKLFRAMIARESLKGVPTRESELQNPPSGNEPSFFRPIPPFDWHKRWSGSAWTWGPQAGDQGWLVEELEEDWHGVNPVETWNLRLGGIVVQAPRLITGSAVELCRLAWLPTTENLLRLEAGVAALQPQFNENDELIALKPPSLTSLRCDATQKVGELEGTSMLEKEREAAKTEKASAKGGEQTELETTEKQKAAIEGTDDPKSSQGTSKSKGSQPPSGLDAIRQALS